MLVAMLSDYTDITAKAKAIKEVEHDGDELTHETYEQLNRIFVTPLTARISPPSVPRWTMCSIWSKPPPTISCCVASKSHFRLAMEMAQTHRAVLPGDSGSRCPSATTQ